MPGRKEQRFVSWARPDQRQFVRSGRSKSRPYAHSGHATQPGHVFLGTPDHVRQHDLIYFFVLSAVLPRRTDQNLPGSARLYVERHRIPSHGVCALQVLEFDQLVAKKPRIAIRNYEMAFALLDFKAGSKLSCTRSSGVHHNVTGNFLTVLESNSSF